MRNHIIEADLKYITDHPLPWEFFRNKTVLVSGASGFLPAYMVETLLYLREKRQYDVKVIGMVRNLERAKSRFAHYEGNPALRLVLHDVCVPFSFDEKLDVIIHAASQATPKYFRDDPVGTLLPNVVGTAQLLNLARDRKVECFGFFSTSGVHGFVDPSCYPVKEDCYGILNPTDLSSCYLESKRMGENMCIAWRHQYGVPVKIIRPAITYGPELKLDDGRSFADFVASMVLGKDIELTSDGTAYRNYCYISDATIGFFLVLLKGEIGQAYNVASEEEIRIVDLARKLTSEVFPEKKLKVVFKTPPGKDFLRVHYSRSAVDISKLKALGWKQQVPLDEGFRRTVESFIGNEIVDAGSQASRDGE